MDAELKPAPGREPEHAVDPLFPSRWSSRAMSGAHIERETLMSLFEAARWSPSSFNNQPWRFVYALRATPAFESYFDLLTPRNKSWCMNAAALIVIASKTVFDHNGAPSVTHSFDTGSAWMSLALQAHLRGLVIHGLQGFDYERARGAVGLPPDHAVEAMCAVGFAGPVEVLPEALRGNEKPNQRKKVAEFAFEGRFPG